MPSFHISAMAFFVCSEMPCSWRGKWSCWSLHCKLTSCESFGRKMVTRAEHLALYLHRYSNLVPALEGDLNLNCHRCCSLMYCLASASDSKWRDEGNCTVRRCLLTAGDAFDDDSRFLEPSMVSRAKFVRVVDNENEKQRTEHFGSGTSRSLCSILLNDCTQAWEKWVLGKAGERKKFANWMRLCKRKHCESRLHKSIYCIAIKQVCILHNGNTGLLCTVYRLWRKL